MRRNNRSRIDRDHHIESTTWAVVGGVGRNIISDRLLQVGDVGEGLRYIGNTCRLCTASIDGIGIGKGGSGPSIRSSCRDNAVGSIDRSNSKCATGTNGLVDGRDSRSWIDRDSISGGRSRTSGARNLCSSRIGNG